MPLRRKDFFVKLLVLIEAVVPVVEKFVVNTLQSFNAYARVGRKQIRSRHSHFEDIPTERYTPKKLFNPSLFEILLCMRDIKVLRSHNFLAFRKRQTHLAPPFLVGRLRYSLYQFANAVLYLLARQAGWTSNGVDPHTYFPVAFCCLNRFYS